MRVIFYDGPQEKRTNFHPLSLSRPIWDLRVGITSLREKLIAKTGVTDVAGFLPQYMCDAYREQADLPVNDLTSLKGDNLLIINSRVKADTFDVSPTGASEIGLAEDGEVIYCRIASADLSKLKIESIEALLESAQAQLPNVKCSLPLWNYAFELVLANPDQLTVDFAAAGKSGIEGNVEQPNAIRGSDKDVFIGRGAVIHPMVVLDAEHGPIFLDEGVEVHPFTRIEGPCFVGKKSILLGTKCREGNSIGEMCRIGGEVEESIIQGYSNKYHDGFLGHAYVGEWVNLGAMTTNSDLKNDYSAVEMTLDGKTKINTGSTKVGSLIGDHTKTSIGTLFNTGSYVGGMCLIMASGVPLAKWIPSFAWLLSGIVTKGFGKGKLYEAAKVAMSRRGKQWTPAAEAMWDEIFKMTKPRRDEVIRRGRQQMLRR